MQIQVKNNLKFITKNCKIKPSLLQKNRHNNKKNQERCTTVLKKWEEILINRQQIGILFNLIIMIVDQKNEQINYIDIQQETLSILEQSSTFENLDDMLLKDEAIDEKLLVQKQSQQEKELSIYDEVVDKLQQIEDSFVSYKQEKQSVEKKSTKSKKIMSIKDSNLEKSGFYQQQPTNTQKIKLDKQIYKKVKRNTRELEIKNRQHCLILQKKYEQQFFEQPKVHLLWNKFKSKKDKPQDQLKILKTIFLNLQQKEDCTNKTVLQSKLQKIKKNVQKVIDQIQKQKFKQLKNNISEENRKKVNIEKPTKQNNFFQICEEEFNLQNIPTKIKYNKKSVKKQIKKSRQIKQKDEFYERVQLIKQQKENLKIRKYNNLLKNIEKEIQEKNFKGQNHKQDFFDKIENNFENRAIQGNQTNYELRIQKEIANDIKIRELEYKLKREQERKAKKNFYEKEKQKILRQKQKEIKNQDQNFDSIQKKDFFQQIQEEENQCQYSSCDNKLQRVKKFADKSNQLINQIQHQIKDNIKLMNTTDDESFQEIQIQIYEQIIQKITLQKLFEKLNKDKDLILKVYEIRDNIKQLDILDQKEKDFIINIFENNEKENFLQGDFIQILETCNHKTKETQQSRIQYKIKIQTKIEQFLQILDNFKESLTHFMQQFDKYSSYDSFIKVQQFKKELKLYVQFYQKVIVDYFQNSHQQILNSKKQVQKIHQQIKEVIQQQSQSKNLYSVNTQNFDKVKQRLCQYEELNISIQDENEAKETQKKVMKEHKNLQNYFEDELRKIQIQKNVINIIEEELLMDKKAKLVQRFYRKCKMKVIIKKLKSCVQIEKIIQLKKFQQFFAQIKVQLNQYNEKVTTRHEL